MRNLPWLSLINPQVLTAGHADWPPHRIEAPRILYNHELVVFTGGPCRVELAGRVHLCENRTYLIVPPEVAHMTINADHPVHRYWVHFDWLPDIRPPAPLGVVPPAKPRRALIRPTPSFVPAEALMGPVRQAARVLALMRDLSLRWNTADAMDRATCRALLLEVLTLLCGTFVLSRPDPQLRLAVEVKTVLEAAAFTGGSVQDRLASLGYSYEHLCRLFRRQFGVTPLAYINAVRIARARRLLVDPQLSIAQVAFEAGFEDPSYFTRVFRRAVGVCPSRYVKE